MKVIRRQLPTVQHVSFELSWREMCDPDSSHQQHLPWAVISHWSDQLSDPPASSAVNLKAAGLFNFSAHCSYPKIEHPLKQSDIACFQFVVSTMHSGLRHIHHNAWRHTDAHSQTCSNHNQNEKMIRSKVKGGKRRKINKNDRIKDFLFSFIIQHDVFICCWFLMDFAWNVF